jgi:hypothetical protein
MVGDHLAAIQVRHDADVLLAAGNHQHVVICSYIYVRYLFYYLILYYYLMLY